VRDSRGEGEREHGNDRDGGGDPAQTHVARTLARRMYRQTPVTVKMA
jgi:hypothetical protein